MIRGRKSGVGAKFDPNKTSSRKVTKWIHILNKSKLKEKNRPISKKNNIHHIIVIKIVSNKSRIAILLKHYSLCQSTIVNIVSKNYTIYF